MPRTIDEGFRDFLTQLTPSDTETQAAKKHRASIEARLNANFAITRFFRTVSFGNGTSISGYSDVDYFAEIPTDNLKKNSNTTLRQVRNALDERFPNTGVRVTCPSVLVPFGTNAKESTEIVPADHVSSTGSGRRIYEIPDCSEEWMKSSPEAHNAYVANLNKTKSYKVKPLIRFIKAWKFYRNVPISSFYLELRVAKYAEGESSIIYSIDIKNILKQLHDNGLARIQDPVGVSGLISPCRTDAQLEDAKSKLATAKTRAEKARQAELDEEIKEAFEWWELLYDGHFPSYYK